MAMPSPRPPLLGFSLFLAAQAPTLLSQLPRASTMASTSRRQKERNRALPVLDAVIQVLSLAKDSCGIPPAQAVFGVACAILTVIRVRFFPLCHGGFLSRSGLGLFGQQTRLRGFWASLRQCVQISRPGVKGKTVE